MTSTASSTTAGHMPTGTRRDFIYIATATVGGIGAAATLVPRCVGLTAFVSSWL